MAFAVITIFTILLYFPRFKRAVFWVTGTVGNGVKSVFVRRAS
jgi:hypothetical protein